MIGDNPEADIVGAQGAGMRTVLITRPGIERVAPRPAPDLRIDTLLEILDYLPPREG
jgi:FMN phosphatase YigB (HAD superfamily)